jgi:hypothetical protein
MHTWKHIDNKISMRTPVITIVFHIVPVANKSLSLLRTSGEVRSLIEDSSLGSRLFRNRAIGALLQLRIICVLLQLGIVSGSGWQRRQVLHSCWPIYLLILTRIRHRSSYTVPPLMIHRHTCIRRSGIQTASRCRHLRLIPSMTWLPEAGVCWSGNHTGIRLRFCRGVSSMMLIRADVFRTWILEKMLVRVDMVRT